MKERVVKEKPVRGIRKVTDNRFLNYYEIEAVDRSGKTFPYYMASRAEDMEGLRINNPALPPDGVTIFSLYGEKRDRVVLVRQFRFPAGAYVYEFPAGLVEKGEAYRETAVREMLEETGLVFTPIEVDPMFERPFFMTDGLTDEMCSMVYGYAEGEVSAKGLEISERIEVVLADRQEAERILREEPLSLNCAFMLMQFISRDEPFSFLNR